MDLFLAGVANAILMDGDEIFAEAKTLTDSSISIGVTAEDIRGGFGNKLFGKYFHDSTFDLTLTDAMFRLDYIAAHVGADISLGGDVFYEESLTVKAITISEAQKTGIQLTNTPVKMLNHDDIYAWVRKSGEKTWVKKTADAANKFVEVGTVGDVYCVRYMHSNSSARSFKVSANFVPKTLTVIMTANLYSGDASNPSTGTKAGYLVIKVPRFLLSGTAELSMTADGASNTPLEGSALAYGGEDECSGNCSTDNGGYYAEIIEAYCNTAWYDVAKEIYFENATAGLSGTVGSAVAYKVFAIYDENTTPIDVTAAEGLTVSCADENVTVDQSAHTVKGGAAGTYTIKASVANNAALAAEIGFNVSGT